MRSRWLTDVECECKWFPFAATQTVSGMGMGGCRRLMDGSGGASHDVMGLSPACACWLFTYNRRLRVA
ncbi:hypothetical protein Efla_002138 [Eimeria flavescens]